MAARAAVLLTVVTGTTAAGNLLVHVLIARAGGVDSYGSVGALLSLGVIAATLASGVQYAVTRRASLSSSSPPALLADGLVASLPWLALIGLAAAFSPAIAGYLHTSALAVVLALAFCASLVLYAIPAGVLVGRRHIATFGVLTCSATVFRLLFGFIFGWGASDGRGALAASAVATFVAALLAVATVLALRAPAVVHRPAGEVFGRLALTGEGAAGAALSALLWGVWTVPVILARHFLPTHAAGDFAAVQLMTGAILFLTAGLATGFYPSIVRSDGAHALRIGFFATFALSACAALVATAVGPGIIGAVYGGRFSTSRPEFMTLGVSVTAVASLTYLLWASHALHRHLRAVGTAIVIACVVELGIGNLWHSSPATLGAGPAISCALGVAGGLPLLARRAGLVARAPMGPSPPHDRSAAARDTA